MRYTKKYTFLYQFFAITLFMIMVCPDIKASEVSKVESDFKNYRLGRFSLSVPTEMKQAATKYVVHYTEFEEFIWKNQNNHKSEREAIWEARLQKVKSKRPPSGVKDIVIEIMDFSHGERWAKGISYYGNSNSKRAAYWDVLIDGESTGVWLRLRGSVNRRGNIIELLKSLSKAYQAPKESEKIVPLIGKGKYYFKHGVVDLPFDISEEVYTRFEGHPLDKYMKLSVEMEVVEEVEEASLSERLSAAMLANFAPGLSIDKIRTQKRKLAGLAGEEVVFKGTEDGDSNLSFSWRYPGKSDSAQEPEILIKMESNDGDLDKKLQLWDSVLESLKPL